MFHYKIIYLGGVYAEESNLQFTIHIENNYFSPALEELLHSIKTLLGCLQLALGFFQRHTHCSEGSGIEKYL